MAKGDITTIGDLIRAEMYRSIPTAQEIEALGLGWALVENYPLVTRFTRLQVRGGAGLAPAQEVNEYAQNMKMGDEFPAVVVTLDNWLVDGHTRTEAARRAGWTSFPAFVLNVRLSDLDPESPLYKDVLALGGAQNKRHGRRMTTAEMTALIKQIAPGATPAEIRKKLHVTASFANMVWNAQRTEAKAAALGIPLAGNLSNSHLKILGGKIDKYTDPVWKRLLALTQDADLRIPEMHHLMDQVEALHSEEERIAFLDGERVNHAPAIRAGTHSSPSKARRVKQGLGYLLKEDNPADSLVEKEPGKKADYLRFLMDAREKLEKIIFYQEQQVRAGNPAER